MTEDRFHEIARSWLKEQADKRGGVRPLAAASGIKHPQISNAINGGQVSWRMFALISDLPGMSMSRVLDQLAERCADVERAPTAPPIAGSTVEVVPRADRAAVAAEARRRRAAKAGDSRK